MLTMMMMLEMMVMKTMTMMTMTMMMVQAGKHTYRLNADAYMSMVTALVLECIQACVAVPSTAAPPQDEFELEEVWDVYNLGYLT